jgi:hypothetical protein
MLCPEGGPARAGMDLVRRPRPRSTTWLPRASGDGPLCNSLRDGDVEAALGERDGLCLITRDRSSWRAAPHR